MTKNTTPAKRESRTMLNAANNIADKLSAALRCSTESFDRAELHTRLDLLIDYIESMRRGAAEISPAIDSDFILQERRTRKGNMTEDIERLKGYIAEAKEELRRLQREAELVIPMRIRNAETLIALWEKELRALTERSAKTDGTHLKRST